MGIIRRDNFDFWGGGVTNFTYDWRIYAKYHLHYKIEAMNILFHNIETYDKMLKSGDYHHCNFCNKQFHQKFNYDRHVLCCEFISKSSKERENEIDITQQLPTPTEMYQLMQHMMVRIQKLENENTKLRRFKRGKITALDWLNDASKCPPPTFTFSDWIRNDILPNVKDYLETVFHQNLLTGLTCVFDNSISKFASTDLPICSFDTKLSDIYVFKKPTNDSNENESNEPRWMKIPNVELDKYLRRVANQFTYDFKSCWYELHKQEIETDEKYSEMYVDYYKQILGGKMSDDTLFHKLRQYLSSQVKRNLKSVVEYDIV